MSSAAVSSLEAGEAVLRNLQLAAGHGTDCWQAMVGGAISHYCGACVYSAEEAACAGQRSAAQKCLVMCESWTADQSDQVRKLWGESGEPLRCAVRSHCFLCLANAEAAGSGDTPESLQRAKVRLLKALSYPATASLSPPLSSLVDTPQGVWFRSALALSWVHLRLGTPAAALPHCTLTLQRMERGEQRGEGGLMLLCARVLSAAAHSLMAAGGPDKKLLERAQEQYGLAEQLAYSGRVADEWASARQQSAGAAASPPPPRSGTHVVTPVTMADVISKLQGLHRDAERKAAGHDPAQSPRRAPPKLPREAEALLSVLVPRAVLPKSRSDGCSAADAAAAALSALEHAQEAAPEVQSAPPSPVLAGMDVASAQVLRRRGSDLRYGREPGSTEALFRAASRTDSRTGDTAPPPASRRSLAARAGVTALRRTSLGATGPRSGRKGDAKPAPSSFSKKHAQSARNPPASDAPARKPSMRSGRRTPGRTPAATERSKSAWETAKLGDSINSTSSWGRVRSASVSVRSAAAPAAAGAAAAAAADDPPTRPRTASKRATQGPKRPSHRTGTSPRQSAPAVKPERGIESPAAPSRRPKRPGTESARRGTDSARRGSGRSAAEAARGASRPGSHSSSPRSAASPTSRARHAPLPADSPSPRREHRDPDLSQCFVGEDGTPVRQVDEADEPGFDAEEDEEGEEMSESESDDALGRTGVEGRAPRPQPGADGRPPMTVAVAPGSGMAFAAIAGVLERAGWAKVDCSRDMWRDVEDVDVLLYGKKRAETLTETYRQKIRFRMRRNTEATPSIDRTPDELAAMAVAKRSKKLVLNYFSGSSFMTLKTRMLRCLRAYAPKDVYSITPPTFIVIPAKWRSAPGAKSRDERLDFISVHSRLLRSPHPLAPRNTWIAKSSHGCRGEGMFISGKRDEVLDYIDAQGPKQQDAYPWVVQLYIENPFLVQQRKFDIRAWVLLLPGGECYFYRQGVCRTSSYEYNGDFTDLFVHLTNHHIQEQAPAYQTYEAGNELFWDKFHEYLQAMPEPADFYEEVLPAMHKITAQTIAACKSHIVDRDVEPIAPFQLLGFDFLLDGDLRSWLLEVNGSPAIAEALKDDMAADLAELVFEHHSVAADTVRHLKSARGGRENLFDRVAVEPRPAEGSRRKRK
eukprot:TRINITY_DN7151_c0_g1_i1.p1 TRINITY_DN7151_c0_g1~~TRINITY_DN7151_c0_g1_i1.p1  ORF type:complete len:1193 (+),score=362.49 TRINITY_DN7151_c0_g1_i1:124-3579(+)